MWINACGYSLGLAIIWRLILSLIAIRKSLFIYLSHHVMNIHGSEKELHKIKKLKRLPKSFQFSHLRTAPIVWSVLEVENNGNVVSFILGYLWDLISEQRLRKLARKFYPPPQSSALSNQLLRLAVITIIYKRLDTLCPASVPIKNHQQTL